MHLIRQVKKGKSSEDILGVRENASLIPKEGVHIFSLRSLMTTAILRGSKAVRIQQEQAKGVLW